MSVLMKGMNVPGGVRAGAAVVQHSRHHGHAVCALCDPKQSAGSCALAATAASAAASCGTLVQSSLVRPLLHAAVSIVLPWLLVTATRQLFRAILLTHVMLQWCSLHDMCCNEHHCNVLRLWHS